MSRHSEIGRILYEARQREPFCAVCAMPRESIHHLLPIASGGDHSEENLIGLCGECHKSAHDRWGPEAGRYRGPTKRGAFVVRLRWLRFGGEFRALSRVRVKTPGKDGRLTGGQVRRLRRERFKRDFSSFELTHQPFAGLRELLDEPRTGPSDRPLPERLAA